MRKVYVNLQVKMILNMNEGVEVSEVIDEMDYNFKSQTTGAASSTLRSKGTKSLTASSIRPG